MSFCFYRIVDGNQVEVSNRENEITISYSSYSNDDKLSQKVSFALISCTLRSRDENDVHKNEVISRKEQTMPNRIFFLAFGMLERSKLQLN